ncbi:MULTISPECIES: DUF3124 domain-containing protein [unclassified Pseudodesulfovibrio]|uniref:DUF3124 domain-containing protein n=1 Tax=unclassified Pseudodesulfovibrio TaxID=2661612 RepID=UPI000FEBE2B8|nr:MULTISPECIES: DUF3124 domain-containing protein [unclassified Pseudodesulfovibrio]MCJ2165862.1 DUF3124 domain-containing protein [Pseudodesulfovibrio sp. S3-i]RWU02705.1 DUF3124 domain-containing protein [Pseudodesulfovibrio sp. S3]
MRIKSLCPIVAILAVLVLSMPALAGRKLTVSKGQTVYVPVYSHIYQGKKGKPYNLSTLLSLRNVDYTHSIVVTSVRYYGSDGQFIKEHFPKPVTIPPMGTKEVHIREQDTEGGSGANFTVKWEGGTEVSVPVIQAVMIGTASTQGISFVCDGVVIEER